jgi:hypothetical protein
MFRCMLVAGGKAALGPWWKSEFAPGHLQFAKFLNATRLGNPACAVSDAAVVLWQEPDRLQQ